jgi:hypothetical protein
MPEASRSSTLNALGCVVAWWAWLLESSIVRALRRALIGV